MTDGANENIGARLRHVRLRNGLSQRALARRAGVVNSTISLIESGQTNPSVGALKRILEAIPISLAQFFSQPDERREQIFFKKNDLTEIGKGGVSLLQVGSTMVGRSVQILQETYKPGSDTGKVCLTHDGEEGGIVISGRLEVTVDDQRRVLCPGDAYYFSSRRPHRFRCIGKEICEVVSACAPPTV
ncbi:MULTISPECIES: cupin domain-containing protein [unclassified Bradyrhizobium]|uniref:cupin domain-containing protein n=1 Tax=unclassified Bradyrhizobium TaxID=2631580 RepID=UPI001CD76EF6|nr:MULTISPECIES: cupin domain-containing protein [unclassified Bradyrhizobium]MCA1386361.1 cupin domain-containing protein [Bradyrhizobium sp. BRP05]MCA1394464.1 cupin domain-containing protein [Bradyrhizobium sp. IC3123]MCA1423957.1 cupin domain-containing protein [Bradyrhizobium sp. BRP23]MCA1431153.1 cupin domain-containing protein [Bradyrhizobium sp. NBAIM16]MCA1480535.1 cupin domain-containing protein [Bradyrhizobium sp. NBAIM08]